MLAVARTPVLFELMAFGTPVVPCLLRRTLGLHRHHSVPMSFASRRGLSSAAFPIGQPPGSPSRMLARCGQRRLAALAGDGSAAFSAAARSGNAKFGDSAEDCVPFYSVNDMQMQARRKQSL